MSQPLGVEASSSPPPPEKATPAPAIRLPIRLSLVLLRGVRLDRGHRDRRFIGNGPDLSFPIANLSCLLVG